MQRQEATARRERTRGGSRSGSLVASHASRAEAAPAFSTGVNPLFDTQRSMSSNEGDGALKPGKKTMEQQPTTRPTAPRPRATGAGRRQRSSDNTSMARRKRNTSPQSIVTTSTTQSDGSRRNVTSAGAAPTTAPSSSRVAQSPQVGNKTKSYARSAPASRNGSINKGSSKKEEFIPAPLVPALLAPVPPPPSKRKGAVDVETGEGVGEVLEDAPDKTIMEMLQTYLKKQDLYTRIVLVVLLLVLAGGAMGAYVVMLWYAISGQNIKYIVLVSVFSVVLFWVLWKYCFSGDQKLQDQSQIAQDIATLYAAIPDHTAVRGVSEKGRAQFTDFKYEKTEMMFTAVTDDGVSLGSERGSELMMDGADPSCPLCNKAYVEGAELSLLPCLHVFHKTCIHKWCNRHIVCPLCKRHLEAAEPLHTLTATYNPHHGPAVQSEPGGNRGYVNNNGGPRNQWRGVLGTAAPGPLSAHGSERGLGGTRSEDGMWNDRVLNAAQQQLGGRHHRVTSFSSETRRANSARGRTGERGGAGGGRGGPPHSSSTGASKGGPQRSQSVSAGGWGGQQQHHAHQQNHRLQRKRSSSFTTASERGRGGSGRVAHGTAPHRGGAGSMRGGDFSTSPRARSDLGVGSREADHVRAASDAMLSRHASRRNNGAGGTKVLTSKTMFGEDFGDGEGWGGGGSERGGGNGESKRRTAVVTVSSNRRGGSQKGVRSNSQGGPAVITVRKGKVGGKGAVAGAAAGGGGGGGARRTRRDSSGSGGPRDTARSGGESESDFGGERVFATNRTTIDDDSPDEVTTKALTYGPRKPKVKKDGPGHRRQSSAGSTSAEEYGVGSSDPARKARRRPSIPGSKSGSGNQSVIASAAATADAVSKLLSRTPQDERATPSNPRRRSSSGAGGGGGGGGHSRRPSYMSDAYSDADSGTDTRSASGARPVARRVSGGRAGSTSSMRSNSGLRTAHPHPPHPQQQSQQQNQQQPQPQLKATPTKTGPVTKGTPAPPMAAARVATWNSNASGLTPALDASHSLSTSETEVGGAPAGTTATPARGADTGGLGSSPSAEQDKGPGSGGRGWNLRIPSSTGSSEFFALASGGGGGTRNNSANTGSSVASAEGAGGDGESDREGGGGGSLSARTSSLATRVFSRSAGSGKIGATAARMFGSNNAAAKIGVAPAGAVGAGDSADEEGAAGPGDIKILRSSSSVQELIQTYEKKDRDRSSSDEKPATVNEQHEWPLPAPSNPDSKRRLSKTFGSRRRGSGISTNIDPGATESELDDDDEEAFERPKLSYKSTKKKSARNSIGSSASFSERPGVYMDDDEDGVPTTILNAMHSTSRSHMTMPAAAVAAAYGEEGGENGDEDEPFERAKLSYGGGIFRSSSGAGPASSSRG